MEFRTYYLDEDSDIWLDCMHWLLYTSDWDLSTLSNLIWNWITRAMPRHNSCSDSGQWVGSSSHIYPCFLHCCAGQRCVYTRVCPNVLDTLLSCLVPPIPAGRPWQVVARNISRTGELLDRKPGGASAFLSWFTALVRLSGIKSRPVFAAGKRGTEVASRQWGHRAQGTIDVLRSYHCLNLILPHPAKTEGGHSSTTRKARTQIPCVNIRKGSSIS